jgi:hypothetical protein
VEDEVAAKIVPQFRNLNIELLQSEISARFQESILFSQRTVVEPTNEEKLEDLYARCILSLSKPE